MNDAQTIFFSLLILIPLFQLKHFLADYPLQTEYMVVGKSLPGKRFIRPLISHCRIHAILTFLLAWTFLEDPIWGLVFAGVDFVTHFTIDRIKADPKLLGSLKGDYFWWALGLDQMLHHLVNGFLIMAMIWIKFPTLWY